VEAAAVEAAGGRRREVALARRTKALQTELDATRAAQESSEGATAEVAALSVAAAERDKAVQQAAEAVNVASAAANERETALVSEVVE